MKLLQTERGIALVLTLAILVIATIMVVGFVSMMRTERQAASSLANNQTAEILAQATVDHAISILDKNIPQPVPPGGSIVNPTNWIISPGLLTTVQGTGTRVQIPLSSNPSASYSSTTQDAELNVPLISSAGYTILPTSDSMRVAWIPVLKNPAVAPSSNNQISNRYAFWIDDENNRINMNTAYGKPSGSASYSALNANSYNYGVPSFPIPSSGSLTAAGADNPFSLGLPSSVNLDVITGIDRDALWNDRLQRQFCSTTEINRYPPGSSFYQQNKFWLTTFSRAPEFNVFGKSRIFLTHVTFQQGDSTTSPPTIGSVGFAYTAEASTTTATLRDQGELLTFHSDGNTNASTSADPTRNPTAAAVAEVAGYLNAKWPGYAHSFVEKWSKSPPTADDQGRREAQQVAWNIYGMAASASHETNNGRWGNQTPASAQPAPTPTRFSAFLWDGPKPDPSWPSSRILPQTRSPFINRFAVSFIATQYRRTNGGLVSGLSGTNRYVVNVRLYPQVMLPTGYNGYQQFNGSTGNGEPWKVSNDELYITHFEATIDDGSGTGGRRVIWTSEATPDPGSLYYDASGGTNLYKLSGNGVPTGVMTPSGDSYNYAGVATAWDFSSSDNTVGVTPSRTISFIFDAGPTRNPCTISNVKIRFIATTGTGSFITPFQISPIRDVDGAKGFEASNAQNSSITDSGAVILPTFQIPTTSIAANTPDYWMTVETLDPRVNQRGTPASGATSSDDWQAVSSTPTLLAPASPLRNTRLSGPYPSIGTAGDESKLAWLDTTPYVGSGTSKTRWGMLPGHYNRRLPSVGLLSCLSTGIQGGVPWRTLRLQQTADDPPDWLLLDLFEVPFNRVNFVAGKQYVDPVPSTLTSMNSTAGKISLNTAIFPNTGLFTPPARPLPVTALFHNAYRPQVAAASVPQPNENSLAANIATYLSNKSSHTFDYAGEICQVPGFSDSGTYDWEKEALVRDYSSLMTTRSNAFSVFGVAQTVKKNPANTTISNQGVFETRATGATADDIVTGEKRFRALVERYVWAGVDGTPGNGNTNPGSSYSQLGGTAYVGSLTNTVDASDPTQSTFFQAFNPSVATIKYRVVYFEYLN